MNNADDAVLKRFTSPKGSGAYRVTRGWTLRTQKWVDGEWVHLATFPTLPKEYEAEQRERMARHALAFGGQVRLLRGALLLASWRDGILECDLREVA